MDNVAVVETVTPPDSAVIFLHGFGDTVEGITVICKRMAHFLRRTRFLIPQAHVTATGESAWYLPDSMTPNGQPDQEGITQAVVALEALVEEQTKGGIDRTRIIVGGFSQGGSVAALYALNQGIESSKCFLLGSFIPKWSKEYLRRGANGKVMIGHSMGDPIILFPIAEEMEKTFCANGFEVELYRYPGMQHAITEQMQAHLIMFLLKVLGNP